GAPRGGSRPWSSSIETAGSGIFMPSWTEPAIGHPAVGGGTGPCWFRCRCASMSRAPTVFSSERWRVERVGCRASLLVRAWRSSCDSQPQKFLPGSPFHPVSGGLGRYWSFGGAPRGDRRASICVGGHHETSLPSHRCPCPVFRRHHDRGLLVQGRWRRWRHRGLGRL